jgi:predicted metal-dependent peptidase
LNHIFDRTIGDLKYAKLANIAYDMAVNSLIPAAKLPKIVIRPGTRPIDPETNQPVSNPYADFIANAPIEQSYEWYFRELKKIVEKEKEKNGGEGDITVAMGFDALDDHGGWGQLDADMSEEVRHKMRELLEEAVLEADRSNNWGDIPMAMQGEIRKILSREIDWKSVVRNFIGRVRSTDRSSTIKRINKKMPYIHPGVKRKLIAKFACFIDQSGSMSDKDISMLFTELEGLAKHVDIDVFFFDTQIDFNSHFLWKKGKTFPTLKRTRCGGTDFDCVAEFLNGRTSKTREHFQTDWSGAFILTDGYAAKMKGTRNTKVMWVLTEGGTKEAIREGDLVVQMKGPDKGKFVSK